MSEQSFFDTEKQLIVRLTDDTLAYIPTGSGGWQCRLDDIAWTSSRISPRGVHEVNLHAADGRVVARLTEFEQIERFYLTLVRQLACRSFFDSVRVSVPAQVGLLEKVLWLGTQSRQAGECWEGLHVEGNAGVVATPDALLVMPPGERRIERLPWGDLSGIRRRAASTYQPAPAVRFYGRDSYLEAPLLDLPAEFMALSDTHRRRLEGERAEYAIPGITCADEDLAQTFSWELEPLRDQGLLLGGEIVLACAFGGALGGVLPGATSRSVTGPEPEEPPAGEEARPIKTVLLLTNRRLLQLDPYPDGRIAVTQIDLGVHQLPMVRREANSLVVGTFELLTDPDQPVDMAADFMRRYRLVFNQILNPFSGDLQAAPPSLAARPPAAPTGVDPFSPEVKPLPDEPPGTGPWRP